MPSRRTKARAHDRNAAQRQDTAGLSAARWLPYVLLAVVIVAVYANSLTGVFLFDDFSSIVRNTQLRHLSDWRAIWMPPADTPVAGRPIAHLSLAVNYAVGGLSVTGYHVVNIALHVICASLIFATVRWTVEAFDGLDRLRQSATITAFAVAAIWAVHPVNSEVVDYLSQRTESLMAACYLGALYSAARAWRSAHAARWLTAAAVLCVVGAFCKESIATAPIAIVLYDRAFAVPTFADAFRLRWRFYAGLTATWAAIAIELALHGQTSASLYSTAPTSAWTYLLNQALIIPHYLRLVVWPTDLVLFYGWTRALTLAEVWPWAAAMAIAAVGSVVLFMRYPKAGFGSVFFFLVLAPTSSVIPIATEVGAERRLYLPIAGLIAWAVLWLAHRKPQRLAIVAVTAAVCLALGSVTIARNADYHSSLGMAETIADRWPSAGAEYLLGTELASAGRHDEAIAHLRAAVDDDPPAGYYLGSELLKTGQLDEAITRLQTLVIREPQLPIIRPSEVMIARAYALKGDWPHAVSASERVLASWPTDADAHGVLADAAAARQDYAAAIPHYRAFLAAQPASAVAWTSLGLAFVATSDSAGAIDAFTHAVDAAPNDAHLRENLARSLLEARRATDAAAEGTKAVTLAPNDPAAHEVLGRALVALGHVADGRRELEWALAIDPGYAPANEALRQLGIRREAAR